MSSPEQKREQTPDLYQSAREVAFGHDGVQMAAEAAAAGGAENIGDLSDRDRQMLAVGTLAGAAGAIARTRYPYEDPQHSLERADLVCDHAREVSAKDRERRPILDDGGEG